MTLFYGMGGKKLISVMAHSMPLAVWFLIVAADNGNDP